MEVKINLPKNLEEEFKCFNFEKVDKNLDIFKNLEKDFYFKDKIVELKNNGFKNAIIIGNGGSISTTYAFLGLKEFYENNFYVLNTNEPKLIKDLRNFFKKKDTIVFVISKSGKTSTVIENYFAFRDYKKVIITGKGSLLYNLSKKDNNIIFEHPNVGGRFTGPTVVSYIPSFFLGLDIDKIRDGFEEAYKKNNVEIEDSDSLKIAKLLYFLEEKGYINIFVPIYSNYLNNLQNVVMQLYHETVCKDGKGGTIFTSLSPESQHHTNQRFFGGRKNILGMFITYKNKDSFVIENNEEGLEKYDDLDLGDALHYEFYGTYQNSINKGIPTINIELDRLDEKEIANFIGFFHYLSIYSAFFRGVNPFDQPAVEDSKNITQKLLEERKKEK